MYDAANVMAARDSACGTFGLEIFGFFRSKAVEDPCMVSFVKS